MYEMGSCMDCTLRHRPQTGFELQPPTLLEQPLDQGEGI